MFPKLNALGELPLTFQLPKVDLAIGNVLPQFLGVDDSVCRCHWCLSKFLSRIYFLMHTVAWTFGGYMTNKIIFGIPARVKYEGSA